MNDSHAGYIVVDASVWVSRLIPQDEFHPRVKAWMEAQRQTDGWFLSPALLLPEVAGAFSRRLGHGNLARRAVDHLKNLPGLRLVEMDQALVLEAANLAAELGLRGADAVYVAAAVRLQLPLATLDQDQMDKASSVVGVLNFKQ